MSDRFQVAIVILAIGSFVFLMWFLFSTAPRPLTNEQIVEQTKFCKDNGLKAVEISARLTMGRGPVKIQCSTKEDSK